MEKDEITEDNHQIGEDDVKKEPTLRELEIARLIKEEEQKGGDADVDDEPVWSLKRAQIEKPSRQCPYLDTIDRFYSYNIISFFAELCSNFLGFCFVVGFQRSVDREIVYGLNF